MGPMPDEQIFPHATGAAEKTVNAHQEPCDLVYHGSWFCPFVQVRCNYAGRYVLATVVLMRPHCC